MMYGVVGRERGDVNKKPSQEILLPGGSGEDMVLPVSERLKSQLRKRERKER